MNLELQRKLDTMTAIAYELCIDRHNVDVMVAVMPLETEAFNEWTHLHTLIDQEWRDLAAAFNDTQEHCDE